MKQITAEIVESKKESSALNNGGIALSVSKAKTFDECKAKYKYTYIQKLPRKEWDFHVFGQFVHEILERYHKVDSDQIDPDTIMTNCFQESLKSFDGKLSQAQKNEAFEIIKKYLVKIKSPVESPVNVVNVEKSFFIDVGGSVLLNGFIDRVQIDPDGIVHVADYKTTKNKKYVNDFFQLLTYAFVLMTEDDSLNKVRASYILVRHDFEYITKEFHRDEVMGVSKKFIDFASQIREEKLWEPSPRFLCKFCDHLDICKEGKSYLIKRKIIKESTFGLSEW